MKFIDSTEIWVHSGAGGDGIISFRSAHNKPKLGADGGDGGKGGDVYLVGTRNQNTLSCVRYRAQYRAEAGQRGGNKGCTGRSGEDLLLPVPVGTQIYSEDGHMLGEILAHGDRLQVAKGGRGGLGNIHFLRPTQQRPLRFTTGGPSQQLFLRLELKLLADVGLCGFPNVGKSTLLSALSSARPKIADYPFTTLTPQLGVVDVDHDVGSSFVMADIPGLIPGASEGKGLGLEFLKHLERTSLIVYQLDSSLTTADILTSYEQLHHELTCFSQELAAKPQLIVLAKTDIQNPDLDIKEVEAFFGANGLEVCLISAATRSGLRELKHKLLERLANKIPAQNQNHSHELYDRYYS